MAANPAHYAATFCHTLHVVQDHFSIVYHLILLERSPQYPPQESSIRILEEGYAILSLADLRPAAYIHRVVEGFPLFTSFT